MSGGMLVSAKKKVQVERKVEVKAQLSASVNVDLQTKVHAIASASVSCLAEIRSQLLAAGEIKIEDEPEIEEDLPEEEDEGEFDSSDEDEALDEEPDRVRETVSDPSSGIFRKDRFEIKVVRNGGVCRCEAPQSGWEGVVEIKFFGKKAVDAVSNRMQVYLLLAIWLEDHHQDFLRAGPFGAKKALCSQRELLRRPLKGVLGEDEENAATSLSRYLENADLVWPEGALPLKACFGG
ncbi:MAG: hypothetical protein IKO55_03825 [Kiritimatiellae bacterium]|nr:hypothetical protein [Kiritimatiellia bacterium]